MKQIRMIKRSIRDAFKSVFRNFSLSIASISCITITLLIVAISMALSYNAENISINNSYTIINISKTINADNMFIYSYLSYSNNFFIFSSSHVIILIKAMP